MGHSLKPSPSNEVATQTIEPLKGGFVLYSVLMSVLSEPIWSSEKE